MASRSEGAHKEPMNEQAIAYTHAAMKCELNQMYSKITEAKVEVAEHSVVINAIQPLDPLAPCNCMIAGVLMQAPVIDVLPRVQHSREILKETIASLKEAVAKKKTEIAEFEAKHSIKT